MSSTRNCPLCGRKVVLEGVGANEVQNITKGVQPGSLLDWWHRLCYKQIQAAAKTILEGKRG